MCTSCQRLDSTAKRTLEPQPARADLVVVSASGLMLIAARHFWQPTPYSPARGTPRDPN